METIWHKLCKLIQLFLLILRMLSFLDKPDDFFLNFFRQIKVIHRCVYCINLFLKNDGLLINVVNQNSQLSKQVCLGNGTHDVRHRYEN